MPVPTSPVRPVPVTPRRVRTWLPFLGLILAATLVAAGVGLTPDGTEVAGRASAWGLNRWGEPPSCGQPWAAWAAVVEGSEPVGAFDACARTIGASRLRRITLQRVALRGGSGQVHAAHLLLAGATRQVGVIAEAVKAAPPRARRAQLDPALLAASALDLGSFAVQFPAGGLYDRALLLRDADAQSGARELSPVAIDLDADEGAWVVAPPAAWGRPGSDIGPPEPVQTPPPLAEGALAWVPERARTHVFAEWLALVDFVQRGPARPPAPTADARWALVAESAAIGPPKARIHAVLRGDPAPAPLAAWVLAALAADAGLDVEARRDDADIQLTAGAATVWFGRCGARWQGPADLAAAPVAIRELHREALAALLAESLREGDWEAAASLVSAPEAQPLPPALGEVLRIRDQEPGGPDPARLVTEADRVLVGWWAARLGEPELARELSATPAMGALERIRADTLTALGEPGARPLAATSAACEDSTLPWPDLSP